MIIDTDKIGKWANTHLKIVISAGLLFLSWVTACRASNPGTNRGMALYYTILCLITLGLGLICAVHVLSKVFDWDLSP